VKDSQTKAFIVRNKLVSTDEKPQNAKTCFEMKHNFREILSKEQQFHFKFSNFPILFNIFVVNTVPAVTFTQ